MFAEGGSSSGKATCAEFKKGAQSFLLFLPVINQSREEHLAVRYKGLPSPRGPLGSAASAGLLLPSREGD